MLTFFHEGDYLFSKLQKNAAFDPGLTLSDLGLLAVLEFHKTNPNYKLNLAFIENISDSKSQYKNLRRAGYLTQINRPGNHWNWEIIVDSFNVRKNTSGVVYLNASSDVSSVREDLPYNYIESSTRFIKVPKDIILTKKLSLSAKGLYIKLLSLSNKDLSKKELFNKSNVSEYSFSKAWDELKNVGYLKIMKKPSHRGMIYDFILCLFPSSSDSLIQLNRDGSFIFDQKREVENPEDGKLLDKSFKSKSHSLHLPIKDTYSLYSYFSNDQRYTKTRNEHLLKILKTYKEQNCDESTSTIIQEFNQMLIDRFYFKHFDVNAFFKRYELSLKSILRRKEMIRNIRGFLKTIIDSNFNLPDSKESYDYEALLKNALVKLPLNDSKKVNKFCRFNQTDYDFEALERELVVNKVNNKGKENKKVNKFGYYQRDYDFEALEREFAVNKVNSKGYDICQLPIT